MANLYLGILIGMIVTWYILPILEYIPFSLEMHKQLLQIRTQQKIKDMTKPPEEKPKNAISFVLEHPEEDEMEFGEIYEIVYGRDGKKYLIQRF